MRRRLLLSYLTLTLVVLLLLELPLGFIYAREQRRRLTASVERDALALSIRAEEGFEANELAMVRNLARDYKADTGGRVVVIRRSGKVIADSDQSPADDENFRNRPEFKSALARKEVKGSRYSKTLGHDILYFAVPIVNGRDLIGALRVTYPTSYVDARIEQGWGILIAIGCVILLIVFLVSLRLARQVTIPIERLAAASADFGSGALDVRVAVPDGPREIRDVTESFNTTAQRLERLVSSQREFVADASHQLRTPLTALRLRLENLESELADSQKQPGGGLEPEGRVAATADVAGSLDEVARLSRLVDGLLELARAERSGVSARALELASIVDGRIEAWAAFADEHEVALASAIDPSISVRATPGRLEQVLDNLIANAIEVSPRAGAIRVSAVVLGSVVTMRVTDEGPGMTDDQRARAFDRFWRVPANRGGAGLGLSIVRQLVEGDGGTVRLDAAPSGGLDVVIELRSP